MKFGLSKAQEGVEMTDFSEDFRAKRFFYFPFLDHFFHHFRHVDSPSVLDFKVLLEIFLIE